jgi:hypothetical protein
MSIAIFDLPLPVVVIENGEEKDGYAIYVESGKTWENDCWCIALEDGGNVRHYLSNQIKIYHNATYGIKKKTI